MVVMGKIKDDLHTSLKKHFDDTVLEQRLEYTHKYKAVIQRLQEQLEVLKSAGLSNISISPLKLKEKTRIKMPQKHWNDLQLVLEIHDRQYLLFLLDNDKIYMHNGVINKHESFFTQVGPTPDQETDGIVYNLSDKESCEDFLKGIATTAAHCVAEQTFYEETGLSTPQPMSRKNGPTLSARKP